MEGPAASLEASCEVQRDELEALGATYPDCELEVLTDPQPGVGAVFRLHCPVPLGAVLVTLPPGYPSISPVLLLESAADIGSDLDDLVAAQSGDACLIALLQAAQELADARAQGASLVERRAAAHVAAPDEQRAAAADAQATLAGESHAGRRRGRGEQRAVAVASAGAPSDAPIAGQNPGDGLTARDLSERWRQHKKTHPVTQFNGKVERRNNSELRYFSNFYDEAGFEFVLPDAFCAGGLALSSAERRVHCNCSEKAIMLCKAAAMGDRDSWGLISEATDPPTIKELGRGVEPWDNDRWSSMVCAVAFEIVYQKFAKTPGLLPTLLATGDNFIVEATARDNVWGIGLDKGDERIFVPSKWKGSNILGWALMETRNRLRQTASAGWQ